MPLYEYECRGCGHRFEALVRPQDTDKPGCPSCNSQDLERLLSLFAASSDSTKSLALKDGRKRGASVRREKEHAQREYEKHHADH
jgi:putative FmdB family regulatory protein